MTEMEPGPDREGDAGLAAEFVLGLLEPDEVRAFERRLAAEPGLRALVARWSEDLVALAEEVAPVAPPAALEATLMRRLFPEERLPLWRRLGIPTAILGAAAAALLAVWVSNAGLLRPDAAAEGPAFAATVAAEDRSLVVAARFEPATGTIRVERSAGAAPEGRVLELWIIPEGGAPVSLGVLPEGGTGELPVPAVYAEGFPAGILAITDEPPGGAPGGVPTGTVHATGPIVAL